MPSKSQSSTALKVIKWTEEEWKAVAGRLLDMKGRDLLSSSDLQEVKAKDVFLAQEALSADRHRKLISISQGFQAIRQRLHDLFETMVVPAQPTGAGNPASKKRPSDSTPHPAKPATREARENVPAMQAEADAAASGHTKQVAQKQVPVATSVAEAKGTPRPTATPDATVPHHVVRPAQTNENNRNGRKPEQASLVGMAPAEQPAVAAAPAAAAEAVHAHTHAAPVVPPKDAAGHRVSPGTGDSAKARARTPGPAEQRAAHVNASARLNAPVAPPAVNLVELARPFVAMVCQELAAALVNAISQQTGAQGLSSAVQTVLSQSGLLPTASQATPGERGKHHAPRPDRPNPEDNHQARSQPPAKGQHPLDEHDEHSAEGDEQPLFDPKLPPSANSTFKPLIGLIGTNVRDLADLQQFYPQLQLTVVTTDAVQGANDLKSCQRMIGVREEIPAQTDEFLRRVFRNRYVRVAGGIQRVREQLNAWLDNPNSMSEPGRPPKQAHGRGPGGTGPKKGQKRRPHPPR
jgi:hypothetical protein